MPRDNIEVGTDEGYTPIRGGWLVCMFMAALCLAFVLFWGPLERHIEKQKQLDNVSIFEKG